MTPVLGSQVGVDSGAHSDATPQNAWPPASWHVPVVTLHEYVFTYPFAQFHTVFPSHRDGVPGVHVGGVERVPHAARMCPESFQMLHVPAAHVCRCTNP
jgi:hypothetical protein